MDILVYLTIVLAVALVGFIAGKLSAQDKIARQPVPCPGQGDDKVYVRFHYLDKRVEVKKFRPTDLDPVVEWKGRLFEVGEWTGDGQVYREMVINGR